VSGDAQPGAALRRGASRDRLDPRHLGRTPLLLKSLELDELGDDDDDAAVARGVDRPLLPGIDTTSTDPADDELNTGWTQSLWSDMHARSSGGLSLPHSRIAIGMSTVGTSARPCLAFRSRHADVPLVR
jgi:hypothetical protein